MTLKQALERSEGHIKRLEKNFAKSVTKWFHDCWAKKLYVLLPEFLEYLSRGYDLYKTGI